MREYAKILCSIWNSRKWRGLSEDDPKLLYFYLHTCPHANMVGCFILPVGYATTDLGWMEDRFRQALDSLCAASLAGWDEEENLVRIIDFLKHDPFTNPSHASGALKIALALPECAQRDHLFRDLTASKHVRADQIAAIKPQALDSLCAASRHQEPEPEPEPEQEPESKVGGGGLIVGLDFSGEDLGEVAASILVAMGADPKTRRTTAKGRAIGGVEDRAIISRWLSSGLSKNEIVGVVAECTATSQSPPNSLKYFDHAMARLIDAKAIPEPTTTKAQKHGTPSPNSRGRLGPVIARALSTAKPV